MIRNFNNTSPPLALQVDLAADAEETVVRVNSTTGYPAPPFVIGIDRGTANEEVCLVTEMTATTFVVERGFDSIPRVHTASTSTVEHCGSMRDYMEANAHIFDTSRDDHTQYVKVSTLTAKGSIFVFDGGEIVQLQLSGTDGNVLTEDSTAPGGISWKSEVPTGTLWAFAGSAAPSGWVLCDGGLYAQSAQASLYAVIGQTYMTTADKAAYPTQFRVPDARGRGLIGAGQGKDWGSGVNLTTRVLGDGNTGSLGEEKHVLVVAEMASHTHAFSATPTTASAGAHVHTVGGSSLVQRNYSSSTEGLSTSPSGSKITGSGVDSAGAHTHTVTVSGTTSAAGSGTAHNTMQPSLVVNFIVKL